MTDTQTENRGAPTGDPLAERIEEFNVWVRSVRDPATAAAEGVRRLTSRNGKAIAQYNIAPLPDGSWAVRTRCEYRCGNFSGVGSPWSQFATRQECVDYFLNKARRHFSRPIRGSMACESQKTASSQMLNQFNEPGLFGFIEPEPCDDA